MNKKLFFAGTVVSLSAFAQHRINISADDVTGVNITKWTYHCTLSIKPTEDIKKRKALGPSYITAGFEPQKFEFSGANKDSAIKKVKSAFETYKKESTTYNDLIAEKTLECSRCSTPEVEPL